MKKLLLTSAALALSIGSAVAADLPSYKSAPPPPPPSPPPLWTGFYVGLNAGYTWSDNSTTTAAAPFFAGAAGGAVPGGVASALAATTIIPTNRSGFIGGGQIGYNWQFTPSIVAGIEADIQGIAGSNSGGTAIGAAPVDGFAPIAAVSINQSNSSLDYLGTVRGRLGWLFTPTLLIYGTGGLAYGGVTSNTTFFQQFVNQAAVQPFFGGSAFSDTRVGWTAGGGVEWMFWPNWSAKVEYLYYDLGTVSHTGVINSLDAGGAPFTGVAALSRTRFDGHIVRAGVNYHFNWGSAPIVAKY